MGGALSQFWATRHPTKILLVGIDNSGKTTITNFLSTQTSTSNSVHNMDSVPTIGYNVRYIQYKNVQFVVFDCGGSEVSQGRGQQRWGQRDRQEQEYDGQTNITGQYGEYGPIWCEYYRGVSGIIFVVDSADVARLHTGRHNARSALHLMYDDVEVQSAVLLVLANKQDLSGACSVAEVAEGLKMQALPKSVKWWCQGTVATSGDGVMEGLDWMAKQIASKWTKR